jgi:hypothetical protein
MVRKWSTVPISSSYTAPRLTRLLGSSRLLQVRAADALSRDAAVSLWRSLASAGPALALVSLLPPPLFPFAPPLALLPGLNALPLLALLAARAPDAVALTGAAILLLNDRVFAKLKARVADWFY